MRTPLTITDIFGILTHIRFLQEPGDPGIPDRADEPDDPSDAQ